eukprot:NODE_4856_length_1838_cov_4.399766.p2 GENE.NODE_4856_length_1838_cov_4.399766~~NODE_4856_length_1838_cov_4.399766.p2  ORF type:complete len:161 (+),score=11.41 NODE_4856_length_1838_cov_4.399766:1322-1804(+)
MSKDVSTLIRDAAVLVLEDGTRYLGQPYGARGQRLGEAVFATGMTGDQEAITDPSYADQIVVMTAPHIRNIGVSDLDIESLRIWVSGLVVQDASRVVSNFRVNRSLDDQLTEQSVVGINRVDRDSASMRGDIFSGTGSDAELSQDEQLALVAQCSQDGGS